MSLARCAAGPDCLSTGPWWVDRAAGGGGVILSTTMSEVLDRVLVKFPGARQTANDQYTAKCPAHDDRHASLCLGIGEKGVVLHCQAGCSTKDVLSAVGLTLADLFPARESSNGKHNGTGKRIVAQYDYLSAEGELLYQVVRYSPKGFTQRRPDGNGGWTWNMQGVQRLLYRLPELLNSAEDRPDDWVFVCEGEKDADNVTKRGLIATTNVSGAGKWSDDYAETLRGRKLAILPHNDPAGEQHGQKVAQSCHGKASDVRIVTLPDLSPKGDVSDWLAAGGTAEELIRLTEASPKWTPETPSELAKPAPRSVRELLRAYPNLRPPVIEGLIRRGETMNVIAPPKTGKSWLVTDLAIAVATGRMWLGQFPTHKGDVLILDNELHGETSAARIPKVAHARGVLIDEFADGVFVENLRGKLKDVFSLRTYFAGIEPGRFKVIVLDAFYRFLPRDTDENDNGTIASIYSQLDLYADRLGCCFVLIHHSTKGSQADKSVTDVGAGAGSQSRATDTHLILRQHEQDGVVVLDAAVRSWAPLDPLCLRWNFPIWNHDSTLDPANLRRVNVRKRKEEAQAEATEPAIQWTPESFVATFLSDQPRTQGAILTATDATKLSERKAVRLLTTAVEMGLAHEWVFSQRTLPHRFCTVPQPLTATVSGGVI